MGDHGRGDLLTKTGVSGRGMQGRIAAPTDTDRTIEKQDFLKSLNEIKEKMDQ